MADHSPEDLGREIDRLWAKLSSTSVERADLFASSPVEASGPASNIAWETVSMLKRQHQRDLGSLTEMLEAKEHALRCSRERQAALETELNALRQRLDENEDHLIRDGLELQSRLEAADGAISEERERREAEARSLRGLLEQTRHRLAAEEARWTLEREQWEKKEHQYLLDLKELQVLAGRYQQDASKSGDETRRLSETLKEAKNAIEKTLAELLRERQIRAESEKERSDALKKVDEVQGHLDNLSKLWDEERAQWRELWDRERSTWESQRAEFASWEESLRTEREAWHSELKAKEQDQLRYAEAMTQKLRDSAELARRAAPASLAPSAPGARRGRRPWLAAAAVFVALAAGVAWWRAATAVSLKIESVRGLPFPNPTALAFDGSLLWSAQWDGRVLALDPADLKPVRSFAPEPGGPYRPAALAAGAGQLWSLDAAQGRILRHDPADAGRIAAARPSPGPAPTALAFDGQSLWSYDAANRSLYRHGADEASFKAYGLDPDAVVTAMAWLEGRLWIYDAKTRMMRIYDFEQESFRRRASVPASETVLALSPAGPGRAWALAGPSAERGAAALVKYAY